MFKKGNNIFSLLVIVLSIFMTSSVNIVNAAEGTDTPATSQTDSGSPGTTSSGDTDTTQTTPTTTTKDWGSQLVTKVQLLNADKQPQTEFGQYEYMMAYWEFSTQTGGVNEGDTMTLDVPKQLTITGDRKGVPVSELIPGGKQIGTADLIKSTRKVIIKFNHYAAVKSKNAPVIGGVYVGTRWDLTQVSENTTVPLDWNVNSTATNAPSSTSSATVTPGQKLDPNELLAKNGTYGGDEGNTIKWTVRVNYKGEKIKDAVYKDTIGPHQTLLHDAAHPITTYSATSDYTAGTLTKDSDNKFANIKPTAIDDKIGFTVKFDGDLNQPAIIEYFTSIDNVDDKSDSYANTGDLLSNKNEIYNYSTNEAYTTLGSDAHTGDQIVSIMGHKLWQVLPDTKLPDYVTINLIQNGNTAKPYATQKVTADSNWSYVFNNLPKYDDQGNEYKYTVQEAPIDGYVSVSDPTNYDITNISKSIRTDMKVNKVWVDNNDPNRPKKIVVDLVDDNHKNVSEVDPNVKQLTLDDSNGWSGTFYNVPVSPTGHWYYSEGAVADDGSWIKVPAQYIESQKDNSNGANTDVTIYNKLATSLTVTKDWEDNNNPNRPTEIKIQLYANDNGKGDKPVGDPVTLNEGNHWAHKFGAQKDEDSTKPADPTNKLPKYDDNNKEIKYSAKEVSVPTGYSEKDAIDTDGTNETITNTLDNPDVKTTSFKVTKDWADSDTVKSHPDIQVQLLANGKPSGNPITLSDKTSWNHTWENLPQTDTNGKITYSVKEIKVAGYNSVITSNADKTAATITNTPITQESTTLNVNKVWNDSDNQDNIRPKEVVVHLFADGKDTNKSITLNAGNEWKDSFKNLDKGPIYTVTEDSVTNYAKRIDKIDDTDFTITNTHTPTKRTFTATKIWSDANNKDGIRPDDVQVQLTANDNNIGDPVTLNSKNGWTHTWSNLDKQANDKDITYSVKEVKVDGYTTNIDPVEGGVQIVNTHTPKVTPTDDKTHLTVTKVWNDDNDKDKSRPSQVSVQLFANDQKQGDPIILNSINDWSYTWNNLDKKNSYSVVETPVSGYQTSLKAVDDNDLIITNTHTPETPSTPGNPDKPTTPTNPTNPVTPTTPVSPSTPETPTNPVIPVEPNTPTTPTGSTPVLPTNPIVPTSPSQPTIPSTTTDKTGSLLPQTGSKEAAWIYSLIGVLILGLVAYLFKKLA